MSLEKTSAPAAAGHATFRVIGLMGLGLTLLALGLTMETARFPVHAVLVPILSGVATWWMGRWADRWVREHPRTHALWLGPVCAVAALGAGALAVAISNGPLAFADPFAYLAKPMFAALYVTPVALLAGLLCGAIALGVLELRARSR